MVKMLNNVDLADPAQASSAIDVVNGLVGGIEIKPEFSNIYDTTTSTTTSNELTRLLESELNFVNSTRAQKKLKSADEPSLHAKISV